jgi:hypothetical protein
MADARLAVGVPAGGRTPASCSSCEEEGRPVHMGVEFKQNVAVPFT